jgi:GcrA cell cycle regulator
MKAGRHAFRDRRLSWTHLQIRQLRQRWSTGVSADKIARELGGGISRDAVLAKVRRLGLPGRRRHDRRPSASTAARAISFDAIPDQLRVRTSEPRRHPIWVVEAKPYVDDPSADAGIPLAQRRSLLELSDEVCRWPVGDPARPDFFFCGAPVQCGKPYCADHCTRAWRREQPSKPKPDR